MKTMLLFGLFGWLAAEALGQTVIGSGSVGSANLTQVLPAPQTLVTFEGGANGVAFTTTTLGASVTGAPGTMFSVTSGNCFATNAAQHNLTLPLNITNVGWTFGTGSLGFVTYYSATPSYFYFYPNTPTPGQRMSAGVWVCYCGPPSGYTFDWFNIQDTALDEFINAPFFSSGAYASGETIGYEDPHDGTTQPTYGFWIYPYQWYWVTLLYTSVTGEHHQVQVYDSNLHYLGGSTSVPNTTHNATRVCLGIQNGSSSAGFPVLCDNLIVDSNPQPQFPLFP
jgi:hypothetical protein